jgi:hypothetical protein
MAPSVDAVGLGTCSGYHVAAFSVVFRFFRLGASLRQRAVTKKQAPAPSYLAAAFQRLLLRFNMKCEVPCKRVISCRELFRIFRREKTEEKRGDSERRAGDVWLERKA